MRKLLLSLAMMVGAVLPATASAVDLSACTTVRTTLSSVQTAVTDAAPGSVVCLADGTYTGTLTLGQSKATPGVMVRAEHPGQASVAHFTLSGSNLIVAQFVIPNGVFVGQSQGNTVEHNKITGGGHGLDMWPGSTTWVQDLTIRGNRFIGPFGEDGIRANRYHDGPDSDPYGMLVEGNEFTNIRENGNHSDCLQAVWGGDSVYFRRNYLHDNRCQGFFIKDQEFTVRPVVAEENLMLRNDAPCGPPLTTCGQPSIFQLFGPMADLTVRRNTIWTPGGGSPTTLRDPGWSGTRIFDSNVIYRPWSDTISPFGTGYSSTNNVAGRAPEGTWPATGFTVIASPPFQDPATDDYRTNDGRGVTWRPVDQIYGPETSGPPPPPVDTDGDGVPDSSDACPNEPGTQPDGCPLPDPDPTCDDLQAQVDQLTADLAAMTASRDSVQEIADAYKVRAEAAEAKLAQIHTISAP